MIVQIVNSIGAANGTSQHALMLARAFARLGQEVLLVDVCSSTPTATQQQIEGSEITCLAANPSELACADLNLVLGLWDSRTKDAARHLSQRNARLILASTVYWSNDMLPDLVHQAEALWYVSWDQASWAKNSWHMAKRVEVVRCAVDVEIFKQSGRGPTGDPWVLGRYSRDVPAKFSPDIPEYLRRIAETHKITFRMLGASPSSGGQSVGLG